MDPGTRLGPYEIFEQLGASDMSDVYRAPDRQLAGDVLAADFVWPDTSGIVARIRATPSLCGCELLASGARGTLL